LLFEGLNQFVHEFLATGITEIDFVKNSLVRANVANHAKERWELLEKIEDGPLSDEAFLYSQAIRTARVAGLLGLKPLDLLETIYRIGGYDSTKDTYILPHPASLLWEALDRIQETADKDLQSVTRHLMTWVAKNGEYLQSPKVPRTARPVLIKTQDEYYARYLSKFRSGQLRPPSSDECLVWPLSELLSRSFIVDQAGGNGIVVCLPRLNMGRFESSALNALFFLKAAIMRMLSNIQNLPESHYVERPAQKLDFDGIEVIFPRYTVEHKRLIREVTATLEDDKQLDFCLLGAERAMKSLSALR
jgi:hypothetical protein